MSASLILSIIIAYFLLLIVVAHFTAGTGDNEAFFLGNRKSPWYVVAFGMIGASLSGVTFISVPGWVEASSFSYMQVVLGYVAGYVVIIKVLLPLYYRLNLTSIYSYLDGRFGGQSYKTYTFKGGIKTIIWTDTLQTSFMLIAVFTTLYIIKDRMFPDLSLVEYVSNSSYSQIFFWEDWRSGNHFVKQFLSGMFITIVMTGLDQDMMQKNLSCRSLSDAQKNMFWLSLILVVVNLVFLSLGAVLYDYAAAENISFAKADELFATVALSGKLGLAVAIFFVIGLIAAAYSSADSALTALTTSFCVDILKINKDSDQAKATRTRKLVHLGFSLVLFLVILIFEQLNDDSVISELFTAAGYTYGPLLGLYAFGLFTRWQVKDRWVPVVAIIAPILSYILKNNSQEWFNYTMSFEHLIINGILTFVGLIIVSKRPLKAESITA